jgi:SCP-2 sterol transfer family
LNAEITDCDPGVLVERIRIGTKALTSTSLAGDGDPVVPWHAGIPIPVSALLGIIVGEALLHGSDVARAYRRRWSMPADWAYTAFRGVLPFAHLCLDPDRAEGVRARFDVRLRGEGAPRAVLSIADGQLDVQPFAPGTKADCHLSADPATLLLVLYGRTGPVVPALTGKVLAWGRKPWLGFTLPTLIRTP